MIKLYKWKDNAIYSKVVSTKIYWDNYTLIFFKAIRICCITYLYEIRFTGITQLYYWLPVQKIFNRQLIYNEFLYSYKEDKFDKFGRQIRDQRTYISKLSWWNYFKALINPVQTFSSKNSRLFKPGDKLHKEVRAVLFIHSKDPPNQKEQYLNKKE